MWERREEERGNTVRSGAELPPPLSLLIIKGSSSGGGRETIADALDVRRHWGSWTGARPLTAAGRWDCCASTAEALDAIGDGSGGGGVKAIRMRW